MFPLKIVKPPFTQDVPMFNPPFFVWKSRKPLHPMVYNQYPYEISLCFMLHPRWSPTKSLLEKPGLRAPGETSRSFLDWLHLVVARRDINGMMVNGESSRFLSDEWMKNQPDILDRGWFLCPNVSHHLQQNSTDVGSWCEINPQKGTFTNPCLTWFEMKWWNS